MINNQKFHIGDQYPDGYGKGNGGGRLILMNYFPDKK